MTEWLACSGEARCFTLSSTIIKCSLQTHSFRPTVTQAAAFDVSLRRSHFWRGSLSYHLIHVSNTLQPDTATILSNLTYGRQPLYYYPVTGYPQVCSFPWPSCLSYLTDRLDQKLPDLGRSREISSLQKKPVYSSKELTKYISLFQYNRLFGMQVNSCCDT